MKGYRSVFLLLVSVGLPGGCMWMIVEPEYANTPTGVFDSLWNEIDHRYALFDVKGIDWVGEYQIHGPRIHDEMSDDELWSEITDTLAVLNDNHVYLMAPGREVFRAGSLYQRPAFSDSSFVDYERDVLTFHSRIESSYLEDVARPNDDNVIVYGKLNPSMTDGRDIGYLYLGKAEPETKEGFATAISSLENSEGIILDLRFHLGGEDDVAAWIASHFAPERTLFMTARAKDGPEHDDFDYVREWYLDPEMEVFSGPVAVLQNAHTHSAGEVMMLAFRVLPQVGFIGETSSGAFSNTLRRELPNGWLYSLSSFLYEDNAGICYEGIGLSPDITVVNTLGEIDAGIDSVLDSGIGWMLSELQ